MQSLQEILPKHADILPAVLRGGSKFTRLPYPPLLPKDVSCLAFCTEAIKASAQKQMIPRTKSKVFFSFLLNLHEGSCCHSNPLIAVWAQINDTSEAPLDATAVQ